MALRDIPVMAVSEEFDRGIRERLRSHYSAATHVLELNCADPRGRGVWVIQPGSPADNDRGIAVRMSPYLAAEIDTSDERMETNLPLTQARGMLGDAAGALKAIGELTTCGDELVRFAAIGPLARACAERAATVHWVISAADRNARLRRALLVELNGLDHLLRYLPHARLSRSATDLESMKRHLVDIAKHELGDCGDDGRLIDGERLPSLTARVNAAVPPHGYAELNVFTHPTGHLHVATTEWSSGGHRQAAFRMKSTVHDEGRLVEAALLPFVAALLDVAGYIHIQADPGLADWAQSCADAWREWCDENGCG